jgi:hypothetical protein
MWPIVGRYLEEQGYRVYVNPDGSDYFDMVARRDGEVGLVELKLDRGAAVLYQALRRRAWGDWIAVALASEGAARRLAGATGHPLRAAIGVWCVHLDRVEVLRAAVPRRRPLDSPVLCAARAEFARWLDRVDDGEIPAGVRWEGLHRDVRRVSKGRRFREWTLEEASASGSGEQR